MGINIQKKVDIPDNSGSQLLRGILQVGGTVVGGIYGGPAGAAAGGAIGGAVGGAVAPDKQAEVQETKPIGAENGSESGSDPMTRRLEAENNHPTTQLAQANQSLNNMPPDVQEQYRPILADAYKRSKYGGQA